MDDSPISVVLEGRALSLPAAGVVRYIRGLLGGFKTIAAPVRLTVVTDHPRGLAAAGVPGIAVGPAHPLLRALWHGVVFPRVAARLGPSVIHLTKPAAFPRRRPAPVVATIYDVIPLDFPETQTLAQRTYWARALPAAARSADHIMTISETSKRRLCERLGVPAERVTVTYPGIDAAFRPEAGTADAATRRRYGLPRPYLLAVGTLEPRKNHALLLHAFEIIARAIPHDLVLAGRFGWRSDRLRAALRRSPQAQRVHLLGSVPDDDLPALYRGAAAMASLSRAEGFSFPPLEAMACGTPTLVSDIPVHREIAGAAALFTPIRTAGEVAERLQAVLADDALRSQLATQGPGRAAAFRWEGTAAATLGVYQRLCA